MTSEIRPAIPAQLRRQVQVEAGHRCAIPTCRHINVVIHHIIPWKTCQKHEYENLIALCPNCHRRADRDEIDKKSLRIYKANLRYTHDRFSQFEVDVLLECYNAAQGESVVLPPYLMLLIKRLLDANYIKRFQTGGSLHVSGIQIDPEILEITKEGKEFVESLGVEYEDA